MMKTKLTLFVAVLAAALFGMGCSSLNKGLVAHYPFSGDAKDASGNGQDGEVKGATIMNGHAQFNGSCSIEIKCESLPQGKSPRTLSFWAKAADIPKSTSAFMVSWSYGNFKGTGFGSFVSAGNFHFYGHGNVEGISFIVGPSDEHLHHHCITHNGKVIDYYIDGENKKSSEVGDRNTSGSVLFVGARPDGTRYFKGSIDEVRIYNRALSAEEIKALYDLEKPKEK
jgi:hypothetical protein